MTKTFADTCCSNILAPLTNIKADSACITQRMTERSLKTPTPQHDHEDDGSGTDKELEMSSKSQQTEADTPAEEIWTQKRTLESNT